MSQRLARASLIAAIYVILVFILRPFSFGPIQLRVAEALTVLPILFPEAVGGLFIGVFAANILGGLGPWDIFGGSAVTLLAAYVTLRYRHSWVAYASPIVFNAFLISLYLHFIFELPYWTLVLSIGVSQTIVVLGLGVPLVRFLRKHYPITHP